MTSVCISTNLVFKCDTPVLVAYFTHKRQLHYHACCREDNKCDYGRKLRGKGNHPVKWSDAVPRFMQARTIEGTFRCEHEHCRRSFKNSTKLHQHAGTQRQRSVVTLMKSSVQTPRLSRRTRRLRRRLLRDMLNPLALARMRIPRYLRNNVSKIFPRLRTTRLFRNFREIPCSMKARRVGSPDRRTHGCNNGWRYSKRLEITTLI